MTTTDRDEMDLEELFAEARRLRPVPSPDLLARILSQAEAVSGERRGVEPAAPVATPPLRRPGWLASLADALGGWPALGGLAACAVIGVGLGMAQPAGLSDLTASIWGETVSVTLGIDENPLSLLEG